MWDTIPPDWFIVGTGDFNGDGLTDILLRSSAGTVTDWLAQSDGTFADNSGNISSTVPTNWQIVGTGNFNGGGSDDILWRADDGRLNDWLGQAGGVFVSNDAIVNSVVSNIWHIVAPAISTAMAAAISCGGLTTAG